MIGCYQIQEEPDGRFARSHSPFINGLPVERYRKIAPGIKIGKVSSKDLVFTDEVGQFGTIIDISSLWEKAFVNSNYSIFREPLIVPVVIDRELNILDGNHRAAGIGINSAYQNAILVENQRDVDSIKKLVEADVFYWPHSSNVKRVFGKREAMASNFSLGEYYWNGYWAHDTSNEEEFEDEEVDQVDRSLKDCEIEKAIKYCVGRSIHQTRQYYSGESLFEPCPGLPYGFQSYDFRSIDSSKLLRKVNEIVRESSVGREENEGIRGVYDSDDIVQEVMCNLIGINYRY